MSLGEQISSSGSRPDERDACEIEYQELLAACRLLVESRKPNRGSSVNFWRSIALIEVAMTRLE